MSNWKDKVIKLIFLSAASTSVLVVALIFLFLGNEAIPFARDPGIGELWQSRWSPVSFVKESFGIIPLITGSLLVTLIAIVLAVPFGVGGAVYLSEIASKGEKEFLKPFIELLAGIPSVVIGFFGLIVLSPLIKQVFHLSSGLNAITGGILLALMAVPTIVSVSEDAIRAVPGYLTEASLALGATRLQTIWKVTVPAAISGISAAILLGIGRVIGETMTVMMVTGNAARITLSPFQSVRTMTATIAAEMGEVPFGSDHYRALFWVGIILLLFTFALVLLSHRIMKKYKSLP
ncbi:MAG: phosphate ABC transporter permease subunit PstC [Candidatus Electryonea clarkiae]|nr:phosphate ABC transporter permease subunit PstC [Candidatus Electryonea clarkiae]MDP8288311.1 phosphate ABC transporter permease subunit PstC [Candidatus Electryonea clarkiae]